MIIRKVLFILLLNAEAKCPFSQNRLYDAKEGV